MSQSKSQRKRIPQRSCVACRAIRPKSELVRIVRTPQSQVRVDSDGKISGRGAYLCHRMECLDHALQAKKLERALGLSLPDGLADELRSQIKQAAKGAESKMEAT